MLKERRQGPGPLVRSAPCHVALLGCIALGGLSCESGDDPCADVLQIKFPPATLPCPDGREAMCAYLGSTGKDVEAHFSLRYAAPETSAGAIDESANAHVAQCLIRHLADHGLVGFLDSFDEQFAGSVSVNGTYSQVVPAASQLAVVTYYEVNCEDGAKCEDCLSMSTDQCAATPMCYVFTGNPIDLSNDCVGAAQPLGCIPFGYVDDQAVEFLRDPAGGCWLVELVVPMPRATEDWTGDVTCAVPDYNPSFACQNPPAP
jgi:hypothetical protein